MNRQMDLDCHTKSTLENSYNEETYQLVIQESFTFIHSCNFYKLFWIFLASSIFGCYMEQIRCFFLTGIWECRAGVIWGPFSQVYGFGAVLIYVILLKLKDKSSLIIFLASMFLGAAFEYAAGLFLELIFNSVSWDYSNEALNIGGKTSLKYALYWGILGLVFTKWIFQRLNYWLEQIKGKTAFIITWVLIVFMTADLICSSLAIIHWNKRLMGTISSGPIEGLLDKYYDNNKMKELFPNMYFN